MIDTLESFICVFWRLQVSVFSKNPNIVSDGFAKILEKNARRICVCEIKHRAQILSDRIGLYVSTG